MANVKIIELEDTQQGQSLYLVIAKQTNPTDACLVHSVWDTRDKALEVKETLYVNNSILTRLTFSHVKVVEVPINSNPVEDMSPEAAVNQWMDWTEI